MKKPYLYASVSIAIWSASATVSKLLLHSFSTMQMLAVSAAFAAAFLLIVNLCKGNLKKLREYRPRDYLITAGVGMLGTFLYNVFLVLGIDHMRASQAMIVNYLWPMMAVVASCILLKEKMTVRKAIAVVLSFLGVVIVTSNGSLTGFDSSNLTGALCCVLAAVSYGLFTAFNKRLAYDSYISMMLFYVLSAVLATVYVLLFESYPAMTGIQSLGFVWVGVCNYAIAFVTWALAMKAGDTAKVANLAYITPFLSLVIAHFVLGDPITVWSLGGLLVIMAGIFLQLKDAK